MAQRQVRAPGGADWATDDDFLTFERGADKALGEPDYTLPAKTAGRALGEAAGPSVDDLVVRAGDPPARLVLLQAGRGGVAGQKAPAQPQLHTPKTAGFRWDQGRAAFSGDPKAFLPLFTKYPGALYDFADGFNERMGAKRNPQGELVGGTGLPREVIGGLVMKVIAGANSDEAAAFKRFRGGEEQVTPQDAQRVAGLVRRVGGPKGEAVARQIEIKASEASQKGVGR